MLLCFIIWTELYNIQYSIDMLFDNCGYWCYTGITMRVYLVFLVDIKGILPIMIK